MSGLSAVRRTYPEGSDGGRHEEVDRHRFTSGKRTRAHHHDQTISTRSFASDLAAILLERDKFQESYVIYSRLLTKAKPKDKGFIGSGLAEAAARAHLSGQQRLAAEQLDAAKRAGLVAIAEDPKDPYYRYAVAQAYRAMSRNDEAMRHLKEAERLEGTRAENIHMYDLERHELYKRLLAEWGAPA